MLPSMLSRHKNTYGHSPFVVEAPNYDTWNLLGKCTTFALLNLAYNNGDILFLTDIKNELIECARKLHLHSEPDTSKYWEDFDDEFIDDNRFAILRLCELLLGTTTNAPVDFDKIISQLGRKCYDWQICLMKYCVEVNKSEEDRNGFTQDIKSIPVIAQKGFSFHVHEFSQRGSFTYTSKDSSLVSFITCFSFPEMNTDRYLAFVGGLSPIPSCLVNDEERDAALDREVIRQLFTYCHVNMDVPKLCNLTATLKVLTAIREAQPMQIGPCTRRLLAYLQSKDVPVADYLTKVYAGEESTVTADETVAYASSEAYLESHDIQLDTYVSLESDDDIEEFPEESEDTPDDLEDDEDPDATPDENDPDNPDDDDLKLEDDLDNEGEEGNDPAPEPEPEPIDPPPSEDPKGLSIEISTVTDLNSHIYRDEIRIEVTRILNDPKTELTSVARTALKRIITYWLNFLTPASIDDMIRSVAEINIKYK